MQIEQITRRVLTAVLAVGSVAGIVGRYQARNDPLAEELLIAWPWGLAVLIALWLTWFRVSLRPGSRPGWAIAFSLLAFGSVIVDGTGFAQQLAQVPIVVVMMVFGARWAAVAAGFFVLGVSTASVLLFEPGLAEFVRQAFGPLIFALFTYLLSYALVHARDAQQRTQSVLDRLRTSSRQVRELSLVQERSRTASELHDGLGHQLTAIGMGLRVAEGTREHDPEAAWREVARTRELSTKALQDLRRWVRALGRFRPREDRGVAAVRALAESFDTTTLDVEVRVSGTERPLDDEREVVLYRVVQEGLTNVVRHSTGDRVLIRLEHQPDRLVITIHDDGAGAEEPGSGYGLSGLADRVREVGGTWAAGTAPEGGFLVRATLPHSPALVP